MSAAPPSAREATPLRAERIPRARVLEACILPRHGRVLACAPASDAGLPTTRLAGLTPLRTPFATRGVLLDLARRARGALSAGAPIAPLELDECAELQGVTLEPGDALLLRTGFPQDAESAPRRGPLPGLDRGCGRWLRERGLVLVGSDAPGVEARVGLLDPEADALRTEALADGLLLASDVQLAPLAEACAATRDYAFLLVVPAPDALGATHPVAVL